MVAELVRRSGLDLEMAQFVVSTIRAEFEEGDEEEEEEEIEQ